MENAPLRAHQMPRQTSESATSSHDEAVNTPDDSEDNSSELRDFLQQDPKESGAGEHARPKKPKDSSSASKKPTVAVSEDSFFFCLCCLFLFIIVFVPALIYGVHCLEEYSKIPHQNIRWESISRSLRHSHATVPLALRKRALEAELNEEWSKDDNNNAPALRKLSFAVDQGNETLVRKYGHLLGFSLAEDYKPRRSNIPMYRQISFLERMLPLAVRSDSSETVYLLRRWMELPAESTIRDFPRRHGRDEPREVCIPMMKRTWELLKNVYQPVQLPVPQLQDVHRETGLLLTKACVVDEESGKPMRRDGGGWNFLPGTYDFNSAAKDATKSNVSTRKRQWWLFRTETVTATSTITATRTIMAPTLTVTVTTTAAASAASTSTPNTIPSICFGNTCRYKTSTCFETKYRAQTDCVTATRTRIRCHHRTVTTTLKPTDAGYVPTPAATTCPRSSTPDAQPLSFSSIAGFIEKWGQLLLLGVIAVFTHRLAQEAQGNRQR